MIAAIDHHFVMRGTLNLIEIIMIVFNPNMLVSNCIASKIF